MPIIFGGDGQSIHPGFASGTYYGPERDNSFTTFSASANTIYAIFVPTGKSTPIDQLACNVQTGAAAGKLGRLAIYTTSGGLPGSLLYDSGTFAVDSTGNKISSLTLTLPPAGAWLCFNSDGAPVLGAATAGARSGLFGVPTITGTVTTYLTQSYTFAAFAATFGSVTAQSGSPYPRIVVRAA